MSAAGSIAGTFVTGFLLIDLFGSRTTMWLVGAVLLSCGIVVGPWHRGAPGRPLPLVVLALFLAGSPFLWAAKTLPGPCEAETSYFCIRTAPVKTTDGRPATGLFLDRLMHSAFDGGDPLAVGYDYERVYHAFSNEQLIAIPSCACW